jgi:O-acetyl-ADP-ribose deacetylase
VGPIYRGSPEDARLLRRAFDAAFQAAAELGAKRVAVPAISCGVYGYPLAEAAEIAVYAARAARGIDEVHFVLFSEKTYEVWVRALAKASAR